MISRAAFFLGALFISSPALAADIQVSSQVVSVTVFPDGAEVTRFASVKVEAGSNRLILRDLPAHVAENSIRVEGVGVAADGLQIGSVDTRYIFEDASLSASFSERKRLEKELNRLKDGRAALDGSIEAAATQKELATNLAKSPLSYGAASTPQAAPMPPDWPALFDLIGGKVAQAQAAILDARVKQRALDEQIKDIETQLRREPPKQVERTEAAIAVEAPSQARAEIAVRYHVQAARWSPLYDARLDTGVSGKEPSLSIIRSAAVSQETGEDWLDASLSLSTARPHAPTEALKLTPMQVQLRPETPPAPPPRPAAAAGQSALAADDDAKKSFRFGAATKFGEDERQMRHQEAAIEAAGFQALFKVPGQATIKSGVGSKKLQIASDVLKPALKAVTAPKDNPTAFLHATFKHSSEAPYLPGRVSLHRDGVFIGTAHLPLLPAGQEYELGFGVDDAVKVSRVSLKRARGETGFISTSTVDEQQFKITVKNLHKNAIAVAVFDQIPFSEDDKVTVALLPATTPPAKVNVDDKRGVLAWTFDAKPGEEKELTLAYRIDWPAKRELDYIPRP